MGKDWNNKRRFQTNSVADRLGRLPSFKTRAYLALRGKGLSIEEALDTVAPLQDNEKQLVLNTNSDEES